MLDVRGTRLAAVYTSQTATPGRQVPLFVSKYRRGILIVASQTESASTLAWEAELGVGPRVTSATSEVDVAQLAGCPCEEYCRFMSGRTAVSSGHDFEFDGLRY